jgi:hypothetical protein
LIAILQRLDAASERLDTQPKRFNMLRDLETQAPEVLAKVEQQLTARRPGTPGEAGISGSCNDLIPA